MRGRGRQNRLGLLRDLVQDLLEGELEELIAAILQYEETHFEDRFPARDQEIVPQLEQSFTDENLLCSLRAVVAAHHLDVLLDRIGEDGYEPGGGKVRRIDHLVLEVRVEVGLEDGDEPVQLVKEKLQHGQVRIEQLGHIEAIQELYHSLECSLFIFKYHEKEASNEIHTLAILDLFVVIGVGFQDVCEGLGVDAGHVVSTTSHIKHNDLFYTSD